MTYEFTVGSSKVVITNVKSRSDGNMISESGSATALKLYNHGATSIQGDVLKNRFPGGDPVTYEFSIGSSNAIVTNLTKSLDGTINIPAVFTVGPNNSQESFSLTSGAGVDGGTLPTDYTCDGAGYSPALSWSAPAGAKEFALLDDDATWRRDDQVELGVV